MEKEKALMKIVRIMQDNNLDSKEVIDFVKKQNSQLPEFDLLCSVNGVLTRLSFAEGKDKNPCGLYPFEKDNRYLELKESEVTLRKFAKENLLPDEDFCELIYFILHQINFALSILERPLLKGAYFVRGKTYEDLNWIISFDDNSTGRMSSDYYDDNEPAKIRYCGVL